jgi:ubiquinone/menaquinone biosynthesis C-methylase UbiE
VSAEREAAARAALAGGGARDWSARNPGNRAIRAELAAAALAAAAPLDGELLDAGCGTGWWLERLAAEGIAAGRLHGVDLLAERVAAARERCPGAHVERADVARLPYADGRFAAVFLFTVLSSLPDRASVRAAAAEAWRVLAAGGRLVVWEPRVPTPANRATRLVRLADLEAATGVHPRAQALTVAPPLARRLGARAARGYPRLARVGVLRTHRLAVCERPSR